MKWTFGDMGSISIRSMACKLGSFMHVNIWKIFVVDQRSLNNWKSLFISMAGIPLPPHPPPPTPLGPLHFGARDPGATDPGARDPADLTLAASFIIWHIGNSQRKHYNNCGGFGAKYVIILFENRFNSLIDFSASDWYNKIPISLF